MRKHDFGQEILQIPKTGVVTTTNTDKTHFCH